MADLAMSQGDMLSGQACASGIDVSYKSSPVEASPLDGYEDVPIYRFTGIPDLQKRVKSQYDALRDGRTTEEYLIFLGVTRDHLAQIDRQRAKIGKNTRMTHYKDTNQLIIKVIPLKLHEAAHISLGDEVKDKLRGMGLPRGTLMPLGAGACRGPTSSKEGDTSYK